MIELFSARKEIYNSTNIKTQVTSMISFSTFSSNLFQLFWLIALKRLFFHIKGDVQFRIQSNWNFNISCWWRDRRSFYVSSDLDWAEHIVTKRSILTILNIDTSAVLAELIGNALRRDLKPNGCKTNKTVWLYFCIKFLIEL